MYLDLRVIYVFGSRQAIKAVKMAGEKLVFTHEGISTANE
jgi:ribosomal protein L30E